jgi:hypothetical protein
LHRRGVERVNCGPKLLDLGEKGVYSSYTFREVSGPKQEERGLAFFLKSDVNVCITGDIFCPPKTIKA